ncbi:TIM50 [Candida pseudojiufengensis]|uniref:TIM50 n=1 Tax=Candida pseudojiufengensis TaxID=497109 RepID=UPI002224EE6B|nr:TIM50 [Candida pseudojiufengensis]KAI5964861.1 TIM50 [Candida pseudojiufengensis]
MIRLTTRQLIKSIKPIQSIINIQNTTSRRILLSNIQQIKFYSSKDPSSSNKKDSKNDPTKPQSILNDDMLARAGFEDIDPSKEKNKTSSETNNTKDSESEPLETNESESTESQSNRRRRKRAQTSKDIKREKYANYFYLSTFIGAILGLGYMSRDWDSSKEQEQLDGLKIDNGYTPQLMYQRLNKRLSSLFTFFSEPVFENLLPPPAPEQYRRPLTLVLTLDDLLIHSEWDSKNGWRTAKRPGLDYFLGYLSQYYEIVLFCTNSQIYSEKAVGKLDPYHAYISYALFREGCRYKDGKLIKDISLLNRDLGKTIMIDVDEDSASLQPENSIIVKKWDGKPDDYLINLIPFLEYLATQPVKDVRPILNSFNDKSNIVEEFQKRETILRNQWLKDHPQNKPNATQFLTKLLGIPQHDIKMPLDIIREHGQLQYQHFQKYLKENAKKFLEEEQKLKDEFGKLTLNKLITEGAPNPEDIAKVQQQRAAEEAEKQKAVDQMK